MKRRILSLALVLVMLLSVNVFSLAASTPSDARQGVAVVVEFINFIDDGYKEAIAYGSCFFVGPEGQDPQYLVTNHHVIEDYLDLGGGAPVALVENGQEITIKAILRVYFDSDSYVEAYPVDYNVSQDFAVLRLDRPTKERIALPIQLPDEGLVGDEVFAIGYPGIADNWIDDPTSMWGVNDSMVSKSTLGRLYTTSGTGDQWLQMTDASWGHGNSGGPILSEQGNVLGLVSSSVHDSGSDEAFSAVDIRPVVTMLNNNGIKFTIRDPEAEAAEAAAKAEEEARLAAEAEAAAKAEEEARLAAEAAAKAEEEARLAAEAEAKAKAEEEARLAAEAEAKAKAEEEARLAAEAAAKKKQTMIIAGAGGAAVIVIIILIILLAKKKKPADNTPVGPVGPVGPVHPTVPKAILRSMAAQHRGGSVPVDSRAINIGRDPSCAVVFSKDTPGVSGVHCSIYFDASSKTFVLTDLKSTYGTYLMTGMKLTPNVPYKLRSGDSFYLGENANTMRVEVE